jgi:hypothetical protein
LANDVAWFESGGFKHQPSHWYLDTRQECRTFKSIASRPCDWLLLVLAMRARGAALTKTIAKVNE